MFNFIYFYVRFFKFFCKICNREGGIILVIFKFKVDLKVNFNKCLLEFEGCGFDELIWGKR